MSSRKSDPKMACPHCYGLGRHAKTAQPCSQCGGSGQVSNEFPFPYHYPFNLTVFNPNALGATTSGGAGALVVPGSPGNPNQQGTNPVKIQLPTEEAYKWQVNMMNAQSPNVVGDASMWIQLALFDLSAQNWPFQSAPIFGNLFAGNGQLPFVILEPLTFTKGTQLTLIGYPVQYSGLVSGTTPAADGATIHTFTFTLPAPVLPGSVVVTSTGISILDNGNGKLSDAGGLHTGSINYITGAGSVTFNGFPTLANQPVATSSQGCARVDAQMDFWGSYLRQYSATEIQAITQNAAA
ncbi:MAG: hypothetical protein WB780_20335 [Candidatus Acidiferrales bacterium]